MTPDGAFPADLVVHFSAGGPLKTVTWSITVDERPAAIRVEHSRSRRELVIWVDGFPMKRCRLPEILVPRHEESFALDGHDAAIVLVPGPTGTAYHCVLDGADVERGVARDELGRDANGQAFRPGMLELSPQRYYRLFPAWFVASAVATAAGVVGLLVSAFVAWRGGHAQGIAVGATATLASGLGWAVAELRRRREHVAWGDARPALVVSRFPLRIAVGVDLAVHDDDHHPAIVVVDQPLDRVREAIRVGDRVVALVAFQHSQDGEIWHGVDVVAAECASEDVTAIGRLHDQLTATDWAQLDRWLERAGHPTTPGTTRVDRAPLRPERIQG